MSHNYFVKIDENNIVVQSTRLEDSVGPDEATGVAYLNKIYKTNDNWKLAPSEITPGYIYNPSSDVFIPPQPFPSWTLNVNNEWEPPVAYPNVADDATQYNWDEDTQSWIIQS
jgi:hypothetical protein